MLLTVLLLVIVIGPPAAAVRIYEQCGGEGYRGTTQCDAGLRCLRRSKWFSSCQVSCPSGWECQGTAGNGLVAPAWEQCGGQGYQGATGCSVGFSCYARSVWYSQCRPDCPADWLCRQTSTEKSTQARETSTVSQTTELIGETKDESNEGGISSELGVGDLIDELIDVLTPDGSGDNESTDEYEYEDYELDDAYELDGEESTDCEPRQKRNLLESSSACEKINTQVPDCTPSGNRAGFCLATAVCKNRGGTSVPGFCMTQPKDIQCCVDVQIEQIPNVSDTCENCGNNTKFSTYSSSAKNKKTKEKKTIYGPMYKGNNPLSQFDGWQNISKLEEGYKEIFIAVAENEGSLDAVHSLDDQILTVGAMQKTIDPAGTGEFPIQVWEFKQSHPDLYEELFERCGWVVEKIGRKDPIMKFHNITGLPLKALIRTGFNKTTQANKIEQSSPALGPLVCAAQNSAFQKKQVEDYVSRFHDRVLTIQPEGHKHPLPEYLKSNLGRATALDQHVNRPGHVAIDFGQALDRFFANNPDASKNPNDWGAKHAEYERKILDDYGEKRRMTTPGKRYAALKTRLN